MKRLKEQESVLNKIRAEIEQRAKPNELGGRGNGKSIRYGLCMALEIIDKYRAEGGDKEWVSVLNGPPIKDGRYYVTRHDDVTQADFVDILWHEKGVWWNRQTIGDYAVIAWRPLPEPYKAKVRNKIRDGEGRRG